MQNFQKTKYVMLIIMDGIGVAPKSQGNAVTLAETPNLTTLWNNYAHTYLLSSSESVGLPSCTKGNSEVGHLNLGAGKVVYQNLPKINRSIENESFFQNSSLKMLAEHSKKHLSNIHIITCLSDGAVHSHIDHLLATIKFFNHQNLKPKSKVLLHLFTDGRDTPPQSAESYFTILDSYIKKSPKVELATICGRYYGMDRSGNWDRTEKSYKLIVNGEGENFEDWRELLQKSYKSGISDEFINPGKINYPIGENVKNGDVVLFLNFRSDRAIQLCSSFGKDNFSQFKTKNLKNILLASMVEYEKNFPNIVLFPKDNIKLPVGRIIAENSLRQLRISETEKFPHVTYFFNGGTNIKYDGENRIEIPSPSVATYDHVPEMSSLEITDVLTERITQKYYNFIVVNFANGDMVGHTGNLNASKLAVEVVDHCVGELTRIFMAYGGTVFITADHGNAEELINPKSGEIDTEHSINPVPLIVAGKDFISDKLPLGTLSDVAPTILKAMGIQIPSDMTGKSLL